MLKKSIPRARSARSGRLLTGQVWERNLMYKLTVSGSLSTSQASRSADAIEGYANLEIIS